MEITEVRIKLMEEGGERLQAFCSITFDDCFVIRDLKIIEGTNGPFVAMPSRKLTSHCPNCNCKNHLRANHCNDCGWRLNPNRAPIDDDGRAKLYADIAHPINSACREMIQDRVIREFRDELIRAEQPGYVSRYDDFDIDDMVPARRNHQPHYARRDGERRDGRGANSNHRGGNHYSRPGSEPTPRVQAAEPAIRPPHKPAVHEGNGVAEQPKSATKPDGFGAGIF